MAGVQSSCVLTEGPGSVAGPSIVYHCVRCTYTHGGHRTGWHRLRVLTSRQLDDGETAHSRRFVERHSGYKAVTASVRAVGELWSSLRCNWPATPGFQWRGSREAGVPTGVGALCSLEQVGGGTATGDNNAQESLRQHLHESDNGGREQLWRAAQASR